MKAPSISEAVDVRLKDLNCFPDPVLLRQAIIEKVPARRDTAIKDVLRDWKAVGQIAATIGRKGSAPRAI